MILQYVSAITAVLILIYNVYCFGYLRGMRFIQDYRKELEEKYK